MAFDFQKSYSPDIEQQLRQYYHSLSEKDRRRFAAIEAITLGHGGMRYIAQVLGCDPQTVHEGMQELKQLPNAPARKRVRKPGGGRKKTEVKHTALIQQVHDLGVPIRVAHYPAYGSKCNPIERRLFSHVTRACQGVVFDSLHTVLGLIQKTKTQQGLAVTVRVLDKLYEGGRTVSEAFKKNMPIIFDTVLPKWNYWAVPQ